MGYFTFVFVKNFIDNHIFTHKCTLSYVNICLISSFFFCTVNLLNWYRVNCENIYDHISSFFYFSGGFQNSWCSYKSGSRSLSPLWIVKIYALECELNFCSCFYSYPLIQWLNTYNNYNITITETARNCDTSDDQLALEGVLPIRRDLPTGNTHGGVMIYYKNSLVLCERPAIENQENTLVWEISKIYWIFGQSVIDSFAPNFDLFFY